LAGTILSLARIPELGRARATALEQAGFQVTTVTNGLEAVLHLLHEHYDLVLLGHAVGHQEDEPVARIASGSQVKVLSFARPLGCAEHFDVAAGPDAFLRRVAQLVGGSNPN